MLAALVALTLAAPAAPTRLAMPEWSTVAVDRGLANFYADGLARALRAHGLEVVTTADMAAVLGLERQKQLLSCSEGSSCMAELGNALGCGGLVVVSLARLDRVLTAHVRVLSPADGKTLAEASAESDSEKDFQARLDRAAGDLADQLRPPEARSVRAKAWVPLVAGAALAAAGGAAYWQATTRLDALDAHLREVKVVDGTATTLAGEGKALEAVGMTGLALGAAGLVTGALMYALGAPPPAQLSAVVTPHGAAVALTLELP